jgi:hypothetical protein
VRINRGRIRIHPGDVGEESNRVPVIVCDVYTGTKRAFGEVKKDKALVYFICRPNQQVNKVNIFDGEQFLAVIKKNYYSFVYLEPGKHFVWWNGLRGNQFEFVPGQTYYLDLN